MTSLRSLASCCLAAVAMIGANPATALDPLRLAEGRPTRPTQQQPAQPPAGAPAQTPPAPTPQAQPNPQPAAPATPQRTEILNFENWAVTCAEFATGAVKRQCSAQLQVAQGDTKRIVLSWTVGLDNEKRPVTVFHTLTGVAIAPGLELHLTKAPVRKIPFATCEPNACTATTPMDAKFIREVAAAEAADAIIQASNGSQVKFSFPVKGFEKAYGALTR